MYHHEILKTDKAGSLRFEVRRAPSHSAFTYLCKTLCLQTAQDTKPTHNNTHLDTINAMNTNTTPIMLLTKEQARK